MYVCTVIVHVYWLWIVVVHILKLIYAHCHRAVATAKQSLDISYITSRIIGESRSMLPCMHTCTCTCVMPPALVLKARLVIIRSGSASCIFHLHVACRSSHWDDCPTFEIVCSGFNYWEEHVSFILRLTLTGSWWWGECVAMSHTQQQQQQQQQWSTIVQNPRCICRKARTCRNSAVK